MGMTPRDGLVRLLTGDQSVGADSALLTFPGDAIELHVKEVGGITLPLRAAQAKRLISVARPALFGRGQETLSDPSVRDTWELTPAQVIPEGAGPVKSADRARFFGSSDASVGPS